MRAVSSALAVALACALVVAAGCGRAPLAPTDGDLVPSSTVGADVVAGWRVEDGFFVSPPLAAPLGATRVGVIARVVGGADVAVFARAVDAPWVPLEVTWRDDVYGRADRFVGRADLGRVARAVEVKVDADDVARLRSLTFEAVVPVPAPSTATTTTPTTTTTTTSAVLDGYQPRSAWGARAASGCDSNNGKNRITVHHTVSRLNEGGTRDQLTAEIRAAQALHMDARGYCDIGYHFLVTSDGTVWEGRNQNHLGAHTGGQNTDNLGVSFVGCFHPTSDCDGLGSTTPPQAMIDGAGAFIGKAARHYGITLNVGSTLLGHRDNPGQSTACPGDRLHARLNDLKAIAVAGAVAPPTTGKVQGTVWNLAITPNAADSADAGARLPGARVTAQQGDRVVGSVVARDGDAYWSFDLAPGAYALVVELDGFVSAGRDVSVASGDDAWASVGVTPVAVAVAVALVVEDAATGAAIDGAVVNVTGVDPVVAGADGRVSVSLPPGHITISASAEGYVSRSEELDLAAGPAIERVLALDLVDVGAPDDKPEDPVVGDDEGSAGVERVVVRNTAGPVVKGGCSQAPLTAPVAGLLALLLRRRRWSLSSP